uniref:Bromo domain-containing protein n=1 Tax=Strongyloides papillosus TaxID=174720 RepID=A0A0N5BR17_STREA
MEYYNPLLDTHLRGYLEKPCMRRHLKFLGLDDGEDSHSKNDIYSRHQHMMALLNRNKERHLAQLSDLSKKLEAVEKVETYRRIKKNGLLKNPHVRTLKRPMTSHDRAVIERIESNYRNNNEMKTRYKNVYEKLFSQSDKYNYLHKLDDLTLSEYKESLKNQVIKMEKIRDLTPWNTNPVMKHFNSSETSWFFKPKSLPNLTHSFTRSEGRFPVKSLKKESKRISRPNNGTNNLFGNKLHQNVVEGSRLPPLVRMPRKQKPNYMAQKLAPMNNKFPSLVISSDDNNKKEPDILIIDDTEKDNDEGSEIEVKNNDNKIIEKRGINDNELPMEDENIEKSNEESITSEQNIANNLNDEENKIDPIKEEHSDHDENNDKNVDDEILVQEEKLENEEGDKILSQDEKLEDDIVIDDNNERTSFDASDNANLNFEDIKNTSNLDEIKEEANDDNHEEKEKVIDEDEYTIDESDEDNDEDYEEEDEEEDEDEEEEEEEEENEQEEQINKNSDIAGDIDVSENANDENNSRIVNFNDEDRKLDTIKENNLPSDDDNEIIFHNSFVINREDNNDNTSVKSEEDLIDLTSPKVEEEKKDELNEFIAETKGEHFNNDDKNKESVAFVIENDNNEEDNVNKESIAFEIDNDNNKEDNPNKESVAFEIENDNNEEDNPNKESVAFEIENDNNEEDNPNKEPVAFEIENDNNEEDNPNKDPVAFEIENDNNEVDNLNKEPVAFFIESDNNEKNEADKIHESDENDLKSEIQNNNDEDEKITFDQTATDSVDIDNNDHNKSENHFQNKDDVFEESEKNETTDDIIKDETDTKTDNIYNNDEEEKVEDEEEDEEEEEEEEESTNKTLSPKNTGKNNADDSQEDLSNEHEKIKGNNTFISPSIKVQAPSEAGDISDNDMLK